MRGTKEPVTMSRSAYHVSGYTSTSDDSSEMSSPNTGDGSSHSSVIKVATANSRPFTNRMPASRGQENTSETPVHLSPTGKPPKVYASVAEMKKAKV